MWKSVLSLWRSFDMVLVEIGGGGGYGCGEQVCNWEEEDMTV